VNDVRDVEASPMTVRNGARRSEAAVFLERPDLRDEVLVLPERLRGEIGVDPAAADHRGPPEEERRAAFLLPLGPGLRQSRANLVASLGKAHAAQHVAGRRRREEILDGGEIGGEMVSFQAADHGEAP
jgi:hypothetical protein